jgi:gliding motility-associated-like protein
LYAISLDGCKSNVLNEPITIYGTNAFAGRDTTVAANQPVQLNATGGISYEWSPSFGLSATNIQNPVATLENDMVYYLKASTPGGCESRDTLRITVYQGPEIYTPNAFTPNGDGLNDMLSPFVVGFQQLNHFYIFNRYGQLVYSHKYGSKGWDGRFNGIMQPTGTFVWVAEGIDYTGKKVVKKGTVLLIR